MTMFGIAALLGPVVGPTLGGWLVVTYDWRWIFYINLPVGILGFLACYALLQDPPYLQAERAELKTQPFNFDGIGLGLLALVMASWEVVLSKGQEWDWLGDPFWRVQTLLLLLLLAAVRPALPRDDVRRPGGQLPRARRAQFHRLLHHHLLGLRRALRGDRGLAGLATDVVRLRRLPLRAGFVAGRLVLDPDLDARRLPARPGPRRRAG